MDTPPSRPKRLLVAEDNPINLVVVTGMLTLLGHQFDAVDNGLDCLRLVDQNEYDLLLTDIQMPGMDGIMVATEIRAMDGPKRSLPIIAMTANAEVAEAARFGAARLDDVLAKPFKKDDLVRCVEKWL